MVWLLIIRYVNNSGQFRKREELNIDSSLLREFSPVCSCLFFNTPYLFLPASASLLLLYWFGYHNHCSTAKHLSFLCSLPKKSVKMAIRHFIIKYPFSFPVPFKMVSCAGAIIIFDFFCVCSIHHKS